MVKKKKASNLGGAREGAGKVIGEDQEMKKRNITLNDDRVNKVKKIFGGSLSQSIRDMIDEYK